MSQWDKLVAAILLKDKNLRFEDLRKALIRIGYTESIPKSGGSHHTFRKTGKMPITVPKQTPINRAYIDLVSKALEEYLLEGNYYE